jgi:hypothetical protein
LKTRVRKIGIFVTDVLFGSVGWQPPGVKAGVRKIGIFVAVCFWENGAAAAVLGVDAGLFFAMN